ncbi:MAG TPA: nucleotidyltransferase domain-containing protein [Candidatus Babeliales bacterium]|nr:nucleotidyltransferase domain-containing protein [Candidatus Babeliales bacterium]
MLFIEPRHWQIVQKILSKYPYSFYAFGSRARGNPKPLSDLDLCFFDHIPSNVLSRLDEDFEESDLPYKVDIVDWNKCSDTFRAIIKKDLVLIE